MGGGGSGPPGPPPPASALAFGQGVAKCVLVKAKVNPSQRSPDEAHEAWVIAKPDGYIVSAHCTCKAG